MSIQYTKGTLKTHLKEWIESNGVNAEARFVAALDEIIQQAEKQCYTDLDLDSLDSIADTATAGTVLEVFKPENLITERLVVISVAGESYPLQKRHRAFIACRNSLGTQGPPRWYAEADEVRWALAPIPGAAYLIKVHGIYRPASLVDGNDNGTTWLSTRMPELLSAAAAVYACKFLKFWPRHVEAQAEYASKLDSLRGQTKNLQRSDVEDIIGRRNSVDTPTIPPEPAAT